MAGPGETQERLEHAEDRADVAEERLRAKTMLLGQFEHKLKTSFTLLTGWANALADDWDRFTDEQRREGMEVVRRRASEVVHQARGLLDETHAEISALDLHPVEMDLAQVLRMASQSYAGAARRHDFRYEGPERLRATVDPAALQQVLGQLLENAIAYSPRGGAVTVRLRSVDDAAVEIQVVDDGIGVPDGVDIFAPFVRGQEAKAASDGSGIGLYIVANLVRSMGGRIDAHRNEGVGSTFSVVLPI